MKLKYDFEIEELAGSFCATPKDECEFIGMIRMNSTAREVFELLQTDTTIEQIVNTLGQKYDVDDEVLALEVEKTIAVFKKNNIVDGD